MAEAHINHENQEYGSVVRLACLQECFVSTALLLNEVSEKSREI